MAVVCTVALLPGMAMSAPADADKLRCPSRSPVATGEGTPDARPRAVETLRGFVAGVDQESDSISIQLSPETTERFRGRTA